MHLLAGLVQCLLAAAGVTQLHVEGVVDQGQAAAGLQDSVGLLEEAWPVKPVEGRHGRHQVHGAVVQRQLFGGTLSVVGDEQPDQASSAKVSRIHLHFTYFTT